MVQVTHTLNHRATMRRLLPLLILITTFLCSYGQAAVDPYSDTASECYKVYRMKTVPLGYGLGSGYSGTPEKAKHIAYFNALESLNIQVLTDTTFIDSTLWVFADVQHPFVGKDTEDMIRRLNYAAQITISNKIVGDADEVKFVSLMWLEYLDRYVTVVCDEVADMDLYFSATCLVKLNMDEFDKQLYRAKYADFLRDRISDDNNLDRYQSIKEWFLKDLEKSLEK